MRGSEVALNCWPATVIIQPRISWRSVRPSPSVSALAGLVSWRASSSSRSPSPSVSGLVAEKPCAPIFSS